MDCDVSNLYAFVENFEGTKGITQEYKSKTVQEELQKNRRLYCMNKTITL